MSVDYYLSLAALFTSVALKNRALAAIPVGFRLCATLYPKLYPIGLTKEFTAEEKEKIERIERIVAEVSSELRLSCEVTVRVTRQVKEHAFNIGTESSPGGTLLIIGERFFDQFESSDPDWGQWLELQKEMPQEPLALGRFLDRCDKAKQERIGELASKFKTRLSNDELRCLISRELGHAKHHHLLKSAALILFVAHASKAFLLGANHIGYGGAAIFAAIPACYLGVKAVSRYHEREADLESIGRPGWVEYNQRQLLAKVVEVGSKEHYSEIEEMAEGDLTASHPNEVEKLSRALKPAEPRKISWWAVAIIGSGAAVIGKETFKSCFEIYQWWSR